jgi:hypothetical protein
MPPLLRTHPSDKYIFRATPTTQPPPAENTPREIKQAAPVVTRHEIQHLITLVAIQTNKNSLTYQAAGKKCYHCDTPRLVDPSYLHPVTASSNSRPVKSGTADMVCGVSRKETHENMLI